MWLVNDNTLDRITDNLALCHHCGTSFRSHRPSLPWFRRQSPTTRTSASRNSQSDLLPPRSDRLGAALCSSLSTDMSLLAEARTTSIGPSSGSSGLSDLRCRVTCARMTSITWVVSFAEALGSSGLIAKRYASWSRLPPATTKTVYSHPPCTPLRAPTLPSCQLAAARRLEM